MSKEALRWLTPILAALTALLEAGHEGNLFSSEIVVLIFAIVTAISAFTAAFAGKDEPQQKPQPQK